MSRIGYAASRPGISAGYATPGRDASARSSVAQVLRLVRRRDRSFRAWSDAVSSSRARRHPAQIPRGFIPAGDQRRVRDTRPGCERAVVRRTSSAPCAAARPLIPGLVGRGELVQSSPSSRPDPPGVHLGRGSAQGTRHPAGMRAGGQAVTNIPSGGHS